MPDGRWGNSLEVSKYSCYMFAPGVDIYSERTMTLLQRQRTKAAQPQYDTVKNKWPDTFTRRSIGNGTVMPLFWDDDDELELIEEPEGWDAPDSVESERYEQVREELRMLVDEYRTPRNVEARNGDIHEPLQPVCHPGREEIGDPGVQCDDYREGYEAVYCPLQPLFPAYPDYESCGEYPCDSPAISPCVRVAEYTQMPEDPYDVPDPEEPEGPELRTLTRMLVERRERQRRDGSYVDENNAFAFVGRTARRRMLFEMCRVYPWLDHCADMYQQMTGERPQCVQQRTHSRNDWPHGPYPQNCNASFDDLPFNTSLLPPVSAFRWDCYFLCGHNYTDLLDRACLWDAVPRNGSVANVTDFLIELLPQICDFVQMGNGSEFLFDVNTTALSFLDDAVIDLMDPGEEEHEFGGSSRLSHTVKNLLLRIVNWIVGCFFDIEFKSLSSADIGDALMQTVFGQATGDAIHSFIAFAKNTNTDRREGDVGLLYWLAYPIVSDCFKLNCADEIWGIPIMSPGWWPAVPRCLPRFVYEKILLRIFHAGYLLHDALVRVPDEGCLDHEFFAIPYSYYCECDDVKMRHCGRSLGFWSGYDNVAFAISYYWPQVHNSTTIRMLAKLTFTEYWLNKFEYYHQSDIQTAYHQCFWITLPNLLFITLLPVSVVIMAFMLCGGVLADFSDTVMGIVVILFSWIGARAAALSEVAREQVRLAAERAIEAAQQAQYAATEGGGEYVGAPIGNIDTAVPVPVAAADTWSQSVQRWQRRLRYTLAWIRRQFRALLRHLQQRPRMHAHDR